MEKDEQSPDKRMLFLVYGTFLTIVYIALIVVILVRRKYFEDIDGYGYYEIALAMIQGRLGTWNQVQKWPPGYPALIIFVNYFTHDYFRAVQILASIFSLIYIISVMLCTYQVTKRHSFTLIMGINTYLSINLWASIEFLADVPFGASFLLVMYFIMKGEELTDINKAKKSSNSKENEKIERKSIRTKILEIFRAPNCYYIFAGFFGGAACLFRWTGMVILVIVIIIFLIRPTFLNNTFKTRFQTGLKAILSLKFWTFISSFFAIWSLWLIPNWILWGSPFNNIIFREIVRWGTLYRPLGLDQYDFDSTFEIIRYDPVLFVKNYIYTFGKFCGYFIPKIFIGPRLVSELGMGPALIIMVFNGAIALYGLQSFFSKKALFRIFKDKQNQIKNEMIQEDLKTIELELNVMNVGIFVILFMLLLSISHFLPRFSYAILPFGFFFFLQGFNSLWRKAKQRWGEKKKSQKADESHQNKNRKYSKLGYFSIIILMFLASFWGSMDDFKYG